MSAVAPSEPLCINCNYPLAQLPDAKCPECGQVFDLADPSTFNPTGQPIGRLSRFALAAPVWPVILIAGVVLLRHLWFLREPQNAMRGSWIFSWYWTCLLAFVPRLVQLFIRNGVAGAYEHCQFLRKLRSRWPAWPFLLVLVIGASVVANRRLPMEWAFRLSLPALEQLADRALSNPSGVATMAPIDAGWVHIRSIEVYGGSTVMLFTENGGGYFIWAFVRMPGCETDEPSLEGFGSINKSGLEGIRRIRGDWFLLFSEYSLHKVGWS